MPKLDGLFDVVDVELIAAYQELPSQALQMMDVVPAVLLHGVYSLSFGTDAIL